METSSVFIFFMLLLATHASIDSIFEEVEQDYHDSQVLAGKSGPPDWDEYEVANKTGEYVRFQHDMIINKDIFRKMMEGYDGRHKRNAVKHTFKLWPHTVPYVIDDEFDLKWKNQILLAIQHVMLLTCVDFKPLGNEKNYVKFITVESDCSSHVGMVGDGEQLIKLAVPKCVRSVSTIVHEIGHALGLFHEHMRNDRDEHVDVIFKNVLEGKKDQFSKLAKFEYNDFGKPYDYRSLMHYGKSYFAKKVNGTREITMQPTKQEYTDVIGKAVGLSFHDVEILNSLYQCAAGCQPKRCRSGEFMGKNCDCFCEGTPENAATRCTQAASCSLPSANSSNEYCLYDELGKVLNYTDEMADGRKVIITYCDFWSCGEVVSSVTCKNGIWEGNTELECIKERCLINPEWKKMFEVDKVFDVSNSPGPSDIVPHGKEIDLFCPDGDNSSQSIVNVLKCSHGKWEGLVIPCTGNECNVTYTPEDRVVYYSTDGTPLNDNEQVANGDVVEASCRNPNTDTEATNVTCIDGKLTGSIPTTCPRADAKCPMIVNAIITSHKVNMFRVQCVEGYDRMIQDTDSKLTTDILTCDVTGTWRPSVPFCSPAKCSIPPVDNGVVHEKANPLPFGRAVESGSEVTLACRYGHVPEELPVRCSLGKWTPTQFPVCTKVVCDKPPVLHTSFTPDRAEHVYKDKVNVTKCKKNKEFKGDAILTCLQDGTWSGKAACEDYCRDGKEKWVDVTSHRFRWNGFKMRARNFRTCKKKCTRQKGFLCLSVSFGYDAGKRKPICYLHRIDLSKQDNMLVTNYRWSVSKRMCVQPVKLVA